MQYLPSISLILLLLFSGASGVFVYCISPLRDPSFVPNSANAGTLLPQFRGISEGDWMLGAFILAMLLAANLVVLGWQWSQSMVMHRETLEHQGMPIVLANGLIAIAWLAVGTVLFWGFWILFAGYLMVQWMVD